jgi:hypothetical protein
MSSFKTGDKVKVRERSSRYHGHVGTVVRTQVRGLAVMYEVSFDQGHPSFLSLSSDNSFLEYQLESANGC